MDAVILFSHGSVLCGAGEALKAHAVRLREAGLAPVVEVGYLNYSEPLFAEAVDRCVAAGAARLLVAPYFLIPGYFVKVDLQKAVVAAQARYPALPFVTAQPMGFDSRLAEIVIEAAQTAAPPTQWREDLRRASQFCRANPQCPLYGTPECPATQKKEIRKLGNKEEIPQFPNFSISQFPALLVMVHGTPRPEANAEMFQVVEAIREKGLFPIVEVGFMECNAPTIPEAIAACAAQGADEIRAVPYFLHTGSHVAEDLPRLLESGVQEYPHIAFRMGDYLGRSALLTDILADRIRMARG